MSVRSSHFLGDNSVVRSHILPSICTDDSRLHISDGVAGSWITLCGLIGSPAKVEITDALHEVTPYSIHSPSRLH